MTKENFFWRTFLKITRALSNRSMLPVPCAKADRKHFHPAPLPVTSIRIPTISPKKKLKIHWRLNQPAHPSPPFYKTNSFPFRIKPCCIVSRFLLFSSYLRNIVACSCICHINFAGLSPLRERDFAKWPFEEEEEKGAAATLLVELLKDGLQPGDTGWQRGPTGQQYFLRFLSSV